MSDLDNYTKLLQEQSSAVRSASRMNLGQGSKPTPEDLLHTIHFPGWYRDVDGGVCTIYKDRLVSIRFNEANGEYNVCVDALSSRGLWDSNIKWDAFDDIREAKSYALSIIKELASIGAIK